MSEMTTGYLYKKIRLERGLRIADVAGEISVSTVSKFWIKPTLLTLFLQILLKEDLYKR